MIKLNQKILEQILEIGGRLLTAGGEAKRVETAITRLCKAYGASSADVFVITSSIVVTARFDDDEPITQTKRITGYSHNLSEFNALNSLSRSICEKPVSAEEIAKMLSEVKHVRRSLPIKVLCWALVSSSFSIFFGGSAPDGFISAFMGIALCLLKSGCDTLSLGNHFSIIICSVIGGLLSIFPGMAGLEVSQFYICIGSIMLFIPGMVLTNSIRDMLAGDTITGLLRFIESLIVSMAVACGFAAFDVMSDTTGSAHVIAQLVTAFLGSLGLAFVFNARIKNAVIGALCGLGGWGAVLLCIELFNSEILGYFVAAALITLSAEILARVLRCPTTLFIVIAILPLVPGKSLYVTMQYATKANWGKFASQGITTLIYSIAIATGIMFVSAVYDAFLRFKNKKSGIR